jgi:phosphoglycerate dehydrogenase-like enzyme
MGSVGSEVARLAGAFGMRVVGMRRDVQGHEPCETWTFDRLDEFLRTVDDLVLAVPLTPDTHHLIGARELGLMKPGSRVVNVARGALIDEEALIDALASGHIGGASLDVFEVEPLPDDSLLWDLPNVIVSPHVSRETAGTARRVEELFLDNLQRFVAGQPLRNEVVR